MQMRTQRAGRLTFVPSYLPQQRTGAAMLKALQTDTIGVALLAGALAAWVIAMFVRDSGAGIFGDFIVGLLGGLIAYELSSWAAVAPHLGYPAIDLAVVGVAGGIAAMLAVGLLRPLTLRERIAAQSRRR